MINDKKILEIYDKLIEERYIRCMTYGSILYNKYTKENGHTYQLTLTKNDNTVYLCWKRDNVPVIAEPLVDYNVYKRRIPSEGFNI